MARTIYFIADIGTLIPDYRTVHLDEGEGPTERNALWNYATHLTPPKGYTLYGVTVNGEWLRQIR